MRAEFAEPSAELFGRAEKSVAQHQRFALSTDEVAKPLAADRREPLLHHRRVDGAFRRNPGGQVRVKLVALHQ